MNLFQVQGKRGGGVVLIAALAMTAPPATAATVTMNGQVVSTDVRNLGGGQYVRLSDVAKALGMVVVKRPGGYDLQKPGGANQVGSTTGKVGDLLFNGQWRFRVQSVQTPDSYRVKTPGLSGQFRGIDNIKNDETAGVVTAVPGYKLVVIECRMANGQKTPQTFWLAKNGVKNALTDTKGESYEPFGYDLVGGQAQSKSLLPGAGTIFPILFSVPEDTQLKDLIFTLRNNDFNDTAKVTDVRVSL
ncbi:MAG: hypothetical protein ABIY70_26805 [Capsulimonas sp.]|uniref:hypothetical protein n=1 Tax=Capsulimonas sp. TaxID=2494211 RepID=UPI0032677F36